MFGTLFSQFSFSFYIFIVHPKYHIWYTVFSTDCVAQVTSTNRKQQQTREKMQKKNTREHLTFLMFRLYVELFKKSNTYTQIQHTVQQTHNKKNGTENKSAMNKGLQWWNSSCDKTTKRNFWICLFYHLSGFALFSWCHFLVVYVLHT